MTTTVKRTIGRLLHILPSGEAVVLAKDLPFPTLQGLKKEYIMRGLKKENLKITY